MRGLEGKVCAMYPGDPDTPDASVEPVKAPWRMKETGNPTTHSNLDAVCAPQMYTPRGLNGRPSQYRIRKPGIWISARIRKTFPPLLVSST